MMGKPLSSQKGIILLINLLVVKNNKQLYFAWNSLMSLNLKLSFTQKKDQFHSKSFPKEKNLLDKILLVFV